MVFLVHLPGRETAKGVDDGYGEALGVVNDHDGVGALLGLLSDEKALRLVEKVSAMQSHGQAQLTIERA